MNDIHIAICANGDIYVGSRAEQFSGVASTIVKLRVNSIPAFGKVGSLSGTAGSNLAFSNSNHAANGTKWTQNF